MEEPSTKPEDTTENVFLDPLPEYLKCPICLCCLDNPYQTPCGHRFCKGCILPVLSSRNNVCPNDRTPIDHSNTFPDNAVRLQINSLKISCPMAGCSWQGELSDKLTHLDKCLFVSIKCQLCGQNVLKTKMEEHLQECPQRQVICQYCKESVPSSNLDTHLQTCPECPVECPNHCDSQETFLRKELQSHVDSKCPRQLVPCTIKPYGCTKMVERASLTEHVQSCLPLHIGEVLTRMHVLDQEVRDLRTTVTSQQEVIRGMEALMYPSSGQFTWRVDNIRTKIRLAGEGDAASTAIYSPAFYSTEAGYKLSLCIYPAGDNNHGYVSLYFVIMKGRYDEILQWPFQKRVYLSLLNTRGAINVTKDIQPDPRLHFFRRPESPRNVGYGYPKFIASTRLTTPTSEFVQNEAIFIRCQVLN